MSKATQPPAPQPRGHRIFSGKRLKVPVVLLLGTAVFFSVPALRTASGQPGKALTHSQIAEANKPGTVMIYTRWTSTISVPREQIHGQALVDFAANRLSSA